MYNIILHENGNGVSIARRVVPVCVLSMATHDSHPAAAATHIQMQQTKQPREVRPPSVPPTISTIMVTKWKERGSVGQICLPNINLLYLSSEIGS